jgi:glycosyltransferase 2 family protein
MTRTSVWVRPLGGAAVLALVAWRVGTGPFVDGVRTVTAWSLVAAAAIAVVTTLCCAWRWRLVAGGLGVALPLRSAVASYYRSQFLNTVLPGGVVGDLHRGVQQGRSTGDVGRGLRAVAWERSAGQVVQALLVVVVLVAAPSPVRAFAPVVLAGLVAVGLVVLLLGEAVPHARPSRWARVRRTVLADVRQALLARRRWPGIVLASAIVVTGHVATFLVAARASGASASAVALLPLALLVLLATGVPLNIGGWGPREGAAAWVFGMAGLTGEQGVRTAVVYGVMVLVASLPVALVLLASSVRRSTTHRHG